MIEINDLHNKVFLDKKCIRFEYEFVVNDRMTVAYFDRNKDNEARWNMQIVFGRTRDKDSEVYNFDYIMPRKGLPLALIAATGLKYFQLCIKQEVQEKSNIDFALGELLKDM